MKRTHGGTARVWLLALGGSAAMLVTTWALIRAHPNTTSDDGAAAAAPVTTSDDQPASRPAARAPVHSRTHAS
jgi:hypothetical protein